MPKPNPEYQAIVDRLNGCLAVAKEYHPNAWKFVDEFRGLRGRKGFLDWPSWCYLPRLGAAIVAGKRSKQDLSGADISLISALAAWRTAKGIYRFDQTLFEELWETPVKGELPDQLLEQAPEWCCYLAFPTSREVLPAELMSDGIAKKCDGFFFLLDYVHDRAADGMPLATGEKSASFTLDHGGSLTNVQLALRGDLSDSLDVTTQQVITDELNERSRRGEGPPDEEELTLMGVTLKRLWENLQKALPPLLSLVIYLCSANADIENREGKKPFRPRPKKVKSGLRTFAAEQPTEWEVGYRIGATLRKAQAEDEAYRKSKGGTHAGPRPHLRRAHWHSFWTGPKAKVGVAKETERAIVVKWLHPILVKEGDTVPVIHKVE